MDGVWAEEVLRDRGGSLPSKSVFALTLMATGSREQAEDAQSKRQLDELRRGEMPEV